MAKRGRHEEPDEGDEEPHEKEERKKPHEEVGVQRVVLGAVVQAVVREMLDELLRWAGGRW